MTKRLRVLFILTTMFGVGLSAQDDRAAEVLKGARQALGGEARLAGVKTLAATGRTRMTAPSGQVEEMEFALSIELPDKFMKREVLMAMGPTSVYRHSGFNGGDLISQIDAPPALSSGGGPGGGVMVRLIDVGPPASGAAPSPEEVAAMRRRELSEARKSFAQLTLGMFAGSFAGYPLTFVSAGQAESPDGKADVIEVSDGAEYKARLFVDASTHLPLMLTWMDREPLVIDVDDADGRGGEVRIVRRGGPGPEPEGGRLGRPNDPAMAERLRQAEANRRVVEFRAYYSDYKAVDGVKLPMRIARTIDGRPSSEILFDRVRVNARIEPKTFAPTK
jgi:hypothetical protein